MKTFRQFLIERPLRAEKIGGKWLYDRKLYVGMSSVNMKTRMIYHPVISWVLNKPMKDEEVAHVYPLYDQGKMNIVYVGAYKKLGFKTLPLNFHEILPTVHKDTGI